MNTELVMRISYETLKIMLLISMPILLAGLIVGVLISIIQVMTQIQEMTLTFVPKIIVVFITMILFGPWMLRKLMDFTVNLISEIPNLVR
ncbi:MAG: flagellar biosynthetic protein FliQ [Deltaproteobacteria bacterium]|nr:MAG: flagellar biosynthetic protein FliQ [Deltaproteobacteria bacterium]